jgi:hypothetical protein
MSEKDEIEVQALIEKLRTPEVSSVILEIICEAQAQVGILRQINQNADVEK